MKLAGDMCVPIWYDWHPSLKMYMWRPREEHYGTMKADSGDMPQ